MKEQNKIKELILLKVSVKKNCEKNTTIKAEHQGLWVSILHEFEPTLPTHFAVIHLLQKAPGLVLHILIVFEQRNI